MTDVQFKRVDGLETIDRLIEFAEQEIAAVGSVKFNLGRVLKLAGISKSSAYHHFGSRDGIIAAVELRHLGREMSAINTAIRSFMETADNAESVIVAFKLWASEEGNDNGKKFRQRRVSAIVAAQASPAIADMLGRMQHEMADYLEGTLRIMVQRDLIAPTLPLRGISHWFFSTMLSRIVVDLTDDPEVTSEWVDVAVTSILAVLRPQT